LCKVMAVRQVALLQGVSDRRIWRTLDYYEAQARAQVVAANAGIRAASNPLI